MSLVSVAIKSVKVDLTWVLLVNVVQFLSQRSITNYIKWITHWIQSHHLLSCESSSESLLQLSGSASGKMQEGKVQCSPPMHAAGGALDGSHLYVLISLPYAPPQARLSPAVIDFLPLSPVEASGCRAALKNLLHTAAHLHTADL